LRRFAERGPLDAGGGPSADAGTSPLARQPTREERLQARLYRLFDADAEPIVAFLRWLAHARSLPLRPRLLDVGCGTGRLLVPLARRGWQVTGMEPHPGFLELARREVRHVEAASVQAGGFAEIAAPRSQDMVVAVNGPFAYLRTRAGQRDALRRIHRVLRPGGVLFLEVADLPRLVRERGATGHRERRGRGPQAIVRTTCARVGGRARHLVLEDCYERSGRPVAHQRHELRILRARDLTRLLTRAGFSELELHHDYASRSDDATHGSHILVSAVRSRSI